MANLPYKLVEIDSKVYESDPNDSVWMLGDYYQGVEVGFSDGRKLSELEVTFFFVLPHVTSKDGVVNLLTVARGVGGEAPEKPSFWDPVKLGTVRGGVYAHVCYDAAREQFTVRMNVGGVTRELLGVTLDGASPELVCGRVLQCYVEVNEDRLFASVNDVFDDDGEVALDGVAPSTGGPKSPWGVSSAGNWWVISGVGDDSGSQVSSLPPGVGLSDLRITLGSAASDSMGSLLYSGALDHLAEAVPPTVSQGEIEGLLRHAAQLRRTADGIERLAMLLPSGT